mgnify:CR=1 FL=1
MLQVSFLREEKERVLEGLKKRNFKQLELVDEAIQLDDERKKTQQELDSQLAEINKISKEIGILMKEGKKEEAKATEPAKAEATKYLPIPLSKNLILEFAALDKFSQVSLYIDFLLKFLYLIVKCRNKKRCDIHHTF